MSTPLHVRTRLVRSAPLSERSGAPVFLKMENEQPSRSFKLRGIGRACQLSVADGAERLISSSGGNAGLAVAYAGQALGVPVTVVVPKTTPESMRATIRGEGAEVLEYGDAWDVAHAHALELCERERGAYIHPFDDARIWDGHATLVEELAAELDGAPAGIVVAVGGGGLLCGVLSGLQRVGWTHVPVFAVETRGADSFAQAMRAGKPVTLESIDSLAKSLGALRVADEAVAWAERHPIVPLVVSDRAAVQAVLTFEDEQDVLVEPACGAALSVAYNAHPSLPLGQPLVVVVCGGACVDRELLAAWTAQTGIA